MKRKLLLLFCTFFLLLSGCFTGSVGEKFGKYFSSLQMAYMSEDDPELVKSSLPLNMKIIEAMILEFPDDYLLLSAASSIFVNYTYGFVLNKADMVFVENPKEGKKLYKRSLKLLTRANSYSLRALKAKYPQFKKMIKGMKNKEIAQVIDNFIFTKEDVEILYLSAASLAGVISSSRGDAFYLLKLPIISAMLKKCILLDPDWNSGALYTARMTLVLLNPQLSLKEKQGKSLVYFNKAITASDGNDCSTYLSLAEGLSVKQQDKKGFMELINKALKVDTKKHFRNRLSNVLCQRKAKWLQNNVDRLFI